MPLHMPTYLRIDQDVKDGLVKVAQYAHEYASFDIEQLEWQTQRKLELELDKQGWIYKDHRREVGKLLTKVNDQLKECLESKDVCVDKRLEKHNTVIDIIKAAKQFEDDEKKDSQAI